MAGIIQVSQSTTRINAVSNTGIISISFRNVLVQSIAKLRRLSIRGCTSGHIRMTACDGRGSARHTTYPNSKVAVTDAVSELERVGVQSRPLVLVV